MQFADDLPATCPPETAICDALNGVYRVLEGIAVTPFDWLTHAEHPHKAKPISFDDECRWHSFSLVKDPKKAIKFKNLASRTHCVKLVIPVNAGMHYTKGNHIDFWRAKGFNLSTCSQTVGLI